MNSGFTCELRDKKYDDAVVWLPTHGKYLVTVAGRFGTEQYQRTFFVPRVRWEQNQEYAMLVATAQTLKVVSSLLYNRESPVICPERIKAFDLEGRMYSKLWGGCGWTGTEERCVKYIVHGKLHFHCPECETETEPVPSKPVLATNIPNFGYAVYYDG